MPRRLTLVVASLALAACADHMPTEPAVGGVAFDVVADPCPPSRTALADELVIPSEEYRTLQAGACAVADGGTIYLQPGSYGERVTIWGKHVTIQGLVAEDDKEHWPVLQAPVPTEVVAARDAEGVITVGDGGSLSLRMARITGGDVGILVVDAAGPVDIDHAVLEQNGRGILQFAPSALTVKHITVSEQLRNGISYVPFDLYAQNCGGLNVSHGVFGVFGYAAIYVRGCVHVIDHTRLGNASGGGIVAIASSLWVIHDDIHDNGVSGILAVNSSTYVTQTDVSFTTTGGTVYDPDGGFLGDAMSFWTTDAPWAQGGNWVRKPSWAYVDHSDTYFSERAAVSSFGSEVALKDDHLIFQAFDVGAESFDGYDTVFDDLGGVLCLHVGDADWQGCLATSYQLEPPPPVGGLE